MDHKLSTVFIIALFIISGACSSKKFGEPVVKEPKRVSTSKTFPNSYTDVWEAAISSLEERNYPIISRRKDQGTITTDWLTGKSDRLFSGYGETRIPYKIRYKHTVVIKPTRRGTETKIQSREQYMTDSITSGMEFQGSLYRWVDTKSSGYKEATILEDISKTLTTSTQKKKGN